MARNTSFSLGEHFTTFVEEQVRSGRYATASDVIRAGLRRLEEEELQLTWLKSHLREAEAEYDAGQTVEDSDLFWESLLRDVDQRLATESQSATDVSA